MQVKQKQVIEAYQRVQAFLLDNPVPAPGSYGEPKTLLDEVVARLTAHSTDQLVGSRLGKADTQRQRVLRKVVREQHLRPIAKIANALLKDSPGIDRATRMPSQHITTTKLLGEAGAFRAAATPYEQTFVKGGRPTDFLARLDAVVEELRQAQLGKARNLGKSVGAKAGMEDEIVRGRQAVEMLDAIVTTTFVGNGELLAKWRRARRIRGASSGGNTGGAVPIVTEPTTAPATVGGPATTPAAAPAAALVAA